jgi:hypothetical protein
LRDFLVQLADKSIRDIRLVAAGARHTVWWPVVIMPMREWAFDSGLQALAKA